MMELCKSCTDYACERCPHYRGMRLTVLWTMAVYFVITVAIVITLAVRGIRLAFD
jgi:hypothetical protein